MSEVSVRDWQNVRPRELRLLLKDLGLRRATQIFGGMSEKEVSRMRKSMRKVLMERKNAAIANMNTEIGELSEPPSLELLDETAAKPAAASGLPPGTSLNEAVTAYEKRVIVATLTKTRGNQSKAARILGTTRRILGYKMMQFGINAKEFKRKRA